MWAIVPGYNVGTAVDRSEDGNAAVMKKRPAAVRQAKAHGSSGTRAI